MAMTPEDQDARQMQHHCCDCYKLELQFQREPHTENTVVVRAISACGCDGVLGIRNRTSSSWDKGLDIADFATPETVSSTATKIKRV